MPPKKNTLFNTYFFDCAKNLLSIINRKSYHLKKKLLFCTKRLLPMEKTKFYDLLLSEISTYKKLLETDNEEWIIKGFIDVNKNVYTISHDTKVVSKIIEIILIPKLKLFAERNGLELELPEAQNYYPDLTFKDKIDGSLFAVDFKTTYYEVVKKRGVEEKKINGMTLGAFSGYFRDRESTKNIQHPYKEYKSHLVLGIVYKQMDESVDEFHTYSLNELSKIRSVIKSFIFFLQPKYKIAIDHPGSGNTKNIGGVADLKKMINGEGPFVTTFKEYAENVFDDYWINYRTSQEAKQEDMGHPHYKDLKSYIAYKRQSMESEKKWFSSFNDDHE